MALKIKPTHVNEKGEIGLDPVVMALLLEFANHAKGCRCCTLAKQGLHYGCDIGQEILQELVKHPDVEQIPDDYGKN